MVFEDIENARKDYVSKRRKIWWSLFGAIGGGLILAFAVACFLGLSWNKSMLPTIIMSGVMIMVIMAVIVNKVADLLVGDSLYKYKKLYKSYFIERQLKTFVEDLDYQQNIGLSKDILSGTGMIDTADRYFSNDLTVGKYKNVKFMQADVCYERECRDDKGRKYYRVVFRGRWMVFEFPKEFNFRMVLSCKKIPTYYVNPKTGKGLKVVKTESKSFNEHFVIQAEDEFEAFYILDPVFMESMEKLGEKHNGKIVVYFCHNRMLIGINDGNDIFEPPDAKKPINEQEELEKVSAEMKLIIDIVENLRLNR